MSDLQIDEINERSLDAIARFRVVNDGSDQVVEEDVNDFVSFIQESVCQ